MMRFLLAVFVYVIIIATVEGVPTPESATDPPHESEKPHFKFYPDDDDNDDDIMQTQEYALGLLPQISDQHNFIERSGGPEVAYVSTYFGKEPTYEKVDPISPPCSAIGVLENVGGEQCTGTFIGDNTILTAAYCLYVHGDDGKGIDLPPKSFIQSKGCDDSKDTTKKGVEYTFTTYYVPNRYIKEGNRNYDYGLIFTKEPTKFKMEISITPISKYKKLAGMKVKTTGYPGEGNPGNCMMESTGTIIGPDPSFFWTFLSQL